MKNNNLSDRRKLKIVKQLFNIEYDNFKDKLLKVAQTYHPVDKICKIIRRDDKQDWFGYMYEDEKLCFCSKCDSTAKQKIVELQREQPCYLWELDIEDITDDDIGTFVYCDSCGEILNYRYYLTHEEVRHWAEVVTIINVNDPKTAWIIVEIFKANDGWFINIDQLFNSLLKIAEKVSDEYKKLENGANVEVH